MQAAKACMLREVFIFFGSRNNCLRDIRIRLFWLCIVYFYSSGIHRENNVRLPICVLYNNSIRFANYRLYNICHYSNSMVRHIYLHHDVCSI